jgi:DNA-binding transcriptional LysR family regulator
MDRFESMAILLKVAEAGSLSAAARRLRTPLATVSRKVSDLEKRLNARLLNRSSRRATLTDAGQAYVLACKRILEDVAEAERAAAGEFSAPRGELVVTAPLVFGRLHVLPVASAFLAAYPDIDIRIVLADRIVNILDDHVDLAVRIGELPDSGLVARRVGAIRRVVCGSPAYFARRGTPENPAALRGHDCVTFEGMDQADAWSFASGKSIETVAVHSRLSVNAAEAAIDAAAAGIGVTRVLSYQMAAALKAGALAVVLRDFEPPPLPVNLVYPSRRLVPLKLRSFIDFAAPRLAQALSPGAA